MLKLNNIFVINGISLKALMLLQICRLKMSLSIYYCLCYLLMSPLLLSFVVLTAFMLVCELMTVRVEVFPCICVRCAGCVRPAALIILTSNCGEFKMQELLSSSSVSVSTASFCIICKCL